MRQAILRAVLIILAAGAAFAFLVVTILSVMLRHQSARVETFVTWGGAAVVMIAVAGLLAVARRRPIGRPWTVTALVVAAIGVAGGAPMLVDHVLLAREASQAQAADAQAARLLHDEIVSREQELAARIAAHRPFTPDEAFGLIWLAGRAAGSGADGARALDLLRRALAAGLIDPNGRVTHGAPAVVGQPLYVAVHTVLVAASPGAPVRTIARVDWDLLSLLVANGADLSLPGGEAVAKDLQRTPVRDAGGRFMHLE